MSSPKISDPFIVVFDVTAEGKSGRVMILNKRNIAWVSPEEEPVLSGRGAAGRAGRRFPEGSVAINLGWGPIPK